jgi:uncharacterized protein DUF3313
VNLLPRVPGKHIPREICVPNLHIEADIYDQHSATTIPAKSGIGPGSRNFRTISATLFSHLAFLSVLTISVLVIGSALRAQDSADQQQTSDPFLGDYSGLVPDAKNSDLLLYEKDPTVLKKYNKFIFDPITIYLLPEARDRGIDPDDLERLAKYFQQAVTNELAKSGSYQIVTAPGADVAELRVAITNVEPTGGGKNAAVKGAATAATVGVAPGASLLVPRLSVGKVNIEGEILDSVSGERLVAFVTGKSGRRWFSGLNTLKKWGDVQAAFRSWAKAFRARLDGVHSA